MRARPPIYLDYNATTPLDPRVLEAMLPYFEQHYGNPASALHAYGWQAKEAVELAREQIAQLLQASPEEIIFTSGATEALNLAVQGIAQRYYTRGRHIITVQTEHRAILEPCHALERAGFHVTYLPVNASGEVSPASIEAAITPDTLLIAVMWANNETGVIQPIESIAAIARKHRVLLLTDATQAVGKVPVSVEHVDLLACSAHKFYGPKGAGVLYVRRKNPRVQIAPLIYGGGQERGLRGGTLNVPAIVGMGKAAQLAHQCLREEAQRLSTLRDTLEHTLKKHFPALRINSAEAPRLPQTSSLTFPGIRADQLATHTRTLAFSAGSACTSASGKPSHVLKAMGLTDEQALSTVRLSLGRFTTPEDIKDTLQVLQEALTTMLT